MTKMITTKVLNPKPPMRIHLQPITGPNVETDSWACGECHRIVHDYAAAIRCCKIPICTKCKEPIEREHFTLCNKCRQEQELERDAKYWAKMEEVEYGGEALVIEDRFFENLEEYLDYIASGEIEDEDIPEFAEICDTRKLGYALNIERIVGIIEEEITEHLEDDYPPEYIVGKDELAKDLRKFIDNQTREVWVPSRKKIDLPKTIKEIEVNPEESKV